MRRARLADEAHPPGFNVVEAADIIENAPVLVDGQGVDGEIPALRVGLKIAAEAHLRMASVGIDVFAQTRDFEGFAIGDERHRAMREAGRDRADAFALRSRQHQFWRRSGREVDLPGGASGERVAHGAADDAGLVAVLVERGEDARQRGVVEQARQRALLDLRRAHWMRPGTIWPFSTCAGT